MSDLLDAAAGIPPEPVTWPTLDPAALHGLAGRVVAVVAPHSEADPVAILLHFLVSVGNLIGPGPHARVEFDHHPARLNVVIVGPSAKGRKGTAWSTPRHLARAVDAHWALASGLSSGEGLIYAVRDPVERTDPGTGEPKLQDEGVADKRLMVVETEFASVLTRIERDGNSLSALLRDAWDTGHLRTLTKNSPLRATGAHVSVLGHITQDELTRLLTPIQMGNGFGNRMLWALARRAQLLPDGGGVAPTQLEPLIAELQRVVTHASALRLIARDAEAQAMWRDIYGVLSRERDGLVGALLARAEAQVLRLGVLYALLDASPAIRPPHLEAALAVWAYCERSVLYLFAGRLGHPMADAIVDALRHAGRLTRTQIRDLFSRNRESTQIEEALAVLERAKLARRVVVETGGRPAEAWEPVTP
jgi:hypothetical protein